MNSEQAEPSEDLFDDGDEDLKEHKPKRKLTQKEKQQQQQCFNMGMESVGTGKLQQKLIFDHLKNHHPMTTVLPTHMGKTWSKQDNPNADGELKYVPKLQHTHDRRIADPDFEVEMDQKEEEYKPVGDNAVDGPRLFIEYKKLFPKADEYLYWDKFTNKWDVEALIEDIHVEKTKGTIKVLKDKEEPKPTDLIEVEDAGDGCCHLPEYQGWNEVDVKHTNKDVDVHFHGTNGVENFNDMYRSNTHYSIQQRLAHYNRDLARNDRLHRAKGMYTLMKMRKHDEEHYQEQRRGYKLNKKTGIGSYRPDTEPYVSLHWKPEPDKKAIFYTNTLMREFHEDIDDDPKEEQFVTVKAVDDLGFIVEADHALHQHNTNHYNKTGKITEERRQEIARNQRIKAGALRKAK
eukprot:CAMPEP_0184484350 /NCGR_PEP_ID=MMETSP0113_2-20130426/6071_1 /TAXON_ID=91329 /ORGANISM="Norrisiella sphaerica, Strain BC52" /LENGTH=402 /DNA_ID=CAMNT_0026865309 /DNA_START=201 /DNA_END=1409 /DNA_ORIENTATION=+